MEVSSIQWSHEGILASEYHLVREEGAVGTHPNHMGFQRILRVARMLHGCIYLKCLSILLSL